jgi:hypothetical protein
MSSAIIVTGRRPRTRRWTPGAAVARLASRRAVRALTHAVSDVTGSELRAAESSVRAGVEEMPDVLRAGFVVTTLMSLVIRYERMFAVGEAGRFGRGLALATVFDERAGAG